MGRKREEDTRRDNPTFDLPYLSGTAHPSVSFVKENKYGTWRSEWGLGQQMFLLQFVGTVAIFTCSHTFHTSQFTEEMGSRISRLPSWGILCAVTCVTVHVSSPRGQLNYSLVFNLHCKKHCRLGNFYRIR